MGTLRTIGSISRDRHISCGLTGRRFTQHRQKPARGERVRVGPWPNSDSFPLQLAILPWYSDGLVLKSKFLSVSKPKRKPPSANSLVKWSGGGSRAVCHGIPGTAWKICYCMESRASAGLLAWFRKSAFLKELRQPRRSQPPRRLLVYGTEEGLGVRVHALPSMRKSACVFHPELHLLWSNCWW